jgi:hypothetical protein
METDIRSLRAGSGYRMMNYKHNEYIREGLGIKVITAT